MYMVKGRSTIFSKVMSFTRKPGALVSMALSESSASGYAMAPLRSSHIVYFSMVISKFSKTTDIISTHVYFTQCELSPMPPIVFPGELGLYPPGIPSVRIPGPNIDSCRNQFMVEPPTNLPCLS